MRGTIAAAALAVSLLAGPGRAADDSGTDGKLPEPSLRFAKEAGQKVTDLEGAWQKLLGDLRKAGPDFMPSGGRQNAVTLREDASRLQAAAKKLLDDQKQFAPDLGRFRDALKKAASSYREVAALYTSHAKNAKSPEVRDDYQKLAAVYDAKADLAAKRAEQFTLHAGLKASAVVIEEGNLLVERLVESLAVGPASDADCQVFAGRLKRHGERCQAFSRELAGEVEKLLGTPAPIARPEAGLPTERRPAEVRATPTRSGAKTPPEPRSIIGVSWTSQLTVNGASCRQILRFEADGTCTQEVYRLEPGGKVGALLGIRRYTFKLDPGSVLAVFSGGKAIEWGEVRCLSESVWEYEIVSNLSNPSRSATRITFTRLEGR